MIRTEPHRRSSISPRTGRRNRIAGQFTAVPTEVMESPAWRTLSLSARRVLDRLCIELRHHAGRQSTELCVTYADFVQYGIPNRHCVGAAIREVVALGFVRITQQGRSGNAEFRQPSLYQLTFIHNADGEPLTNDWKRIESLADAKTIAGAARNPQNRKNRKPVTDSVTRVGIIFDTETRSRSVSKMTPRSRSKMTPLSESLGEGGRAADGGGVSPSNGRTAHTSLAGPAIITELSPEPRTRLGSRKGEVQRRSGQPAGTQVKISAANGECDGKGS